MEMKVHPKSRENTHFYKFHDFSTENQKQPKVAVTHDDSFL